MPSIWRKTGGSWSKIKTVYRKTGGSWQSVKRVWRKTSGVWQLVFQQSLTPSIDTKVTVAVSTANATTQTKKLTGTLYHWNNATGVTYQFAKGTVIGNYTNITGASGTSTNPGTGSSNTNDQYTLSQSDLVANATNYFIYISKATNSTYSTEQTSPSDPDSFEMPRDILDLTIGAKTATSVALSWTTVTGAGSYNVYYGTGSSPTTLFTTTTSGSVTVTGLSAGTTYYFRILPYTGSSGNGYYGNYSNEVNTSTDTIYVFSFGDEIHVSTNGYVTLKGTGNSSDSINSTSGNVVGILPGDLQQSTATSIWYWSDSTDYIIRWEGYHYNQPSNIRTYQIRFTSGASYASIYALYVNNTTEGTQAFVQNGVTKTSYSSALSTGSQYRVYFDGSTSPVSISSELEKGTSQMVQVGGLTSGSTDVGYTTLTTAAGQQITPGALSITSKHFGSGYIYMFYTIGVNTNGINATASRYDYINGNGVQSKSNSVSGIVNTRGYLVLDVSQLGSYNNSVPWSISATPKNGNNLGTSVSDSVSAATNDYPVATVGTVTAGNGTLSATVTLSGAANYYTLQVTPSGGSTTTYNQQTGNISLSGLSNGITYTLDVIPKYYYYYNSVDANSYTYSGTTVSRTGTPSAPTYTITYNGNGNDGGSTSATSGQLPLTVAANGFTKTGNTFNGWNTASGGGGTSYSVGATYNTASNLTLYAQWTLNTYTISYDANGGSGAPSSQTKTYGVTLTLSSTTPTRTGYTFNGWNTNSSGTGTDYAAGASYTTNAGATLYAKWTQNATAPSAPTNLAVGTLSYNHGSGYGNGLDLATTLTRNSNTDKTQNWTYSAEVSFPLSWTKSTGATDYEIYGSSSSTAPASSTAGNITTSAGDVSSYTFKTTQSNRGTITRYFWVKAKNTAGSSGWSSVASKTSAATTVANLSIKLYRGNGTSSSSPSTPPADTALTYRWTGITDRGNPTTGGEGHYARVENLDIAGTSDYATSNTV